MSLDQGVSSHSKHACHSSQRLTLHQETFILYLRCGFDKCYDTWIICVLMLIYLGGGGPECGRLNIVICNILNTQLMLEVINILHAPEEISEEQSFWASWRGRNLFWSGIVRGSEYRKVTLLLFKTAATGKPGKEVEIATQSSQPTVKGWLQARKF